MLITAENGFDEDDVNRMVSELKERGLITFLRNYLVPGPDGQLPSLRKLLLGLGVVPVGSS